MTTLAISEMFGPTFQGEGPSAGHCASFLRLARCNLDCVWCDTPYTWDWTRYDPKVEVEKAAVEDIADWFRAQHTPLLVITGGEPLIQRTGLDVLVGSIPMATLVEIETNGTLPPLETSIASYNVSLKLAHSGVPPEKAIVPASILALQATGEARWKFVCRNEDDLAEVDALVARFDLDDIWIMPEGTDRATLLQRATELAPHVLARRWNLTGRCHVDLWGGERGH